MLGYYEARGTLEPLWRTASADELEFLLTSWELWSRSDQLPPATGRGETPWTTWLVLGGRGAGKTRTGAEWIRALACGSGAPDVPSAGRIALVAENLNDARTIMVEGVSGLLAIHPAADRPQFEPTKRKITWPNGAVAQLFSADDPDSLRGPQFDAAWCDELCKWRHADATWDMLQMGLRLGPNPRQIITTTPRPMALLKRIMEAAGTVLTRVPTAANAAHLAPAFLSTITAQYRGTRLGRQELDAEIIDDNPHALWRRGDIDKGRVAKAPACRRIVVGVDPPASAGAKSNACGIIVAGLGGDRHAYVLADRTRETATPAQWARAAVAAYHAFEADVLVAEVNQGGDMVRAIVEQIDASVSYRAVRATRGKWIRAEPVAALYEQGRVRHVGQMPALEDQMCEFVDGSIGGAYSPDRVDALVWALTHLMLDGEAGSPRIRRF